MAGPESMRGRELERVERNLFLAAGPVGVRGREELRAFLSFGCWNCGYERGRELLTILVAFKRVERRKDDEALCWSILILNN